LSELEITPRLGRYKHIPSQARKAGIVAQAAGEISVCLEYGESGVLAGKWMNWKSQAAANHG
jgi:hypothetical protein